MLEYLLVFCESLKISCVTSSICLKSALGLQARSVFFYSLHFFFFRNRMRGMTWFFGTLTVSSGILLFRLLVSMCRLRYSLRLQRSLTSKIHFHFRQYLLIRQKLHLLQNTMKVLLNVMWNYDRMSVTCQRISNRLPKLSFLDDRLYATDSDTILYCRIPTIFTNTFVLGRHVSLMQDCIL